MVNNSFLRVTTQPTANKSRTLIPPAARSPILRALSCSSGGSLEARIEMKTTLSTPSTISSVRSAASALQAVGSEIQSMSEEITEVCPAPLKNSSALLRRFRDAVTVQLGSIDCWTSEANEILWIACLGSDRGRQHLLKLRARELYNHRTVPGLVATWVRR